MDEKIVLGYQVSGSAAFIQASKDSEIALRRQAKALNETSLELQKEIQVLRGAVTPNKELIAAKQKLLQQNKLLSGETRQQIGSLKLEQAALKQQALATKEAAGGMEALTAASKGLGATTKSLLAPLLAVFAAFETVNILKTADAFTQLQGKIKNSLTDVTEFDGVFQKLVDSSNRSGTALDGVAQAFVRLRPAAENLGVTNDQLIRFNETFSKMGALAGATGEEVKNAMIQLSQGIASGTLRGDELRSVLEQMPTVARTIADSMGIPFEKFRKAAQEGKITADQVFKAIINKSEEVDVAFNKLPGSIGRSLNRIGNSLTLLVGGMNKATGATEGISRALDNLAQIVNELTPGVIKTVSAFNAFFSELLRGTGLLFEAGKAIVQVAAEVAGLGDAFRALMGIDLTSYFFNLADGLDVFTTRLQMAFNEVKRFKSNMANNLKPLQSDAEFSEKENATNTIADSANQTLEMAYRARQAQRVRAYQNLMSATTRAQSNPSGGIRSLPADEKKKKKRGKSAEEIDQQHIEDVTRNFQHQIEQAQAKSALDVSRMGPFPGQENVLQKQLLAEQNTAALLNRELIKLNSTSVKTADGQRALKEASAKVKDEIVKQEKSVQDAKNALEKYQKERNFDDFKREEDQRLARSEFYKEQAMKAEDEQASAEQQSYQNRMLTINEYYDRLEEHIQNKLNAEQQAHDETIRLLDDEIAKRRELFGPDDNSNGVKDLLANRAKENLRFESVLADTAAESDQVKRQRKQDLAQAARDFKGELQNSIAGAIKDAFTGSGPLVAIKNFVKNMYNLVADTLANAIAAGLAKSKPVLALSDWVGNWVNRISGNGGISSGSLSSMGLQEGELDYSFQNATAATPGLTLQGAVSNTPTVNGSRFAGLSKILAPIAGAIGSYQVGKASGQKFGKFGGALAGMGGGMAIGALAGSVLGPVGTILGAAIGGTIGGIAGIMGGGKNRQAERAAYHQNELQPFLDKVVNGADANNLNDLMARRLQAARGMEGKGSDGMKAKRAAMAQIDDLIKQRKTAIDNFLKDIAHQNEQLKDQIAIADAKPLEKAALERQAAMKQIEYDTQLLLDQYKDSEQAKTAILEQESLKRQQLLQQEQDDFKTKTQNLRDLLLQRDDIANANVFTRLRSPEQQKADKLSALDQQIAQTILELKGMQQAGIGADSLGSNQLLSRLGQFLQTNNLQFIVNGANDPKATSEEITRQLDSFFRKAYGANVT